MPTESELMYAVGGLTLGFFLFTRTGRGYVAKGGSYAGTKLARL